MTRQRAEAAPVKGYGLMCIPHSVCHLRSAQAPSLCDDQSRCCATAIGEAIPRYRMVAEDAYGDFAPKISQSTAELLLRQDRTAAAEVLQRMALANHTSIVPILITC